MRDERTIEIEGDVEWDTHGDEFSDKYWTDYSHNASVSYEIELDDFVDDLITFIDKFALGEEEREFYKVFIDETGIDFNNAIDEDKWDVINDFVYDKEVDIYKIFPKFYNYLQDKYYDAMVDKAIDEQ